MISRLSDQQTIFNAEGAMGQLIGRHGSVELVRLTVAPHALPYPVTFVVVTGTVRMTIGDAEVVLASGDAAGADAGVRRGMINDRFGEAVILVIKEVA